MTEPVLADIPHIESWLLEKTVKILSERASKSTLKKSK
jgi:hypothetical protein